MFGSLLGYENPNLIIAEHLSIPAAKVYDFMRRESSGTRLYKGVAGLFSPLEWMSLRPEFNLLYNAGTGLFQNKYSANQTRVKVLAGHLASQEWGRDDKRSQSMFAMIEKLAPGVGDPIPRILTADFQEEIAPEVDRIIQEALQLKSKEVHWHYAKHFLKDPTNVVTDHLAKTTTDVDSAKICAALQLPTACEKIMTLFSKREISENISDLGAPEHWPHGERQYLLVCSFLFAIISEVFPIDKAKFFEKLHKCMVPANLCFPKTLQEYIPHFRPELGLLPILFSQITSYDIDSYLGWYWSPYFTALVFFKAGSRNMINPDWCTECFRKWGFHVVHSTAYLYFEALCWYILVHSLRDVPEFNLQNIPSLFSFGISYLPLISKIFQTPPAQVLQQQQLQLYRDQTNTEAEKLPVSENLSEKEREALQLVSTYQRREL